MPSDATFSTPSGGCRTRGRPGRRDAPTGAASAPLRSGRRGGAAPRPAAPPSPRGSARFRPSFPRNGLLIEGESREGPFRDSRRRAPAPSSGPGGAPPTSTGCAGPPPGCRPRPRPGCGPSRARMAPQTAATRFPEAQWSSTGAASGSSRTLSTAATSSRLKVSAVTGTHTNSRPWARTTSPSSSAPSRSVRMFTMVRNPISPSRSEGLGARLAAEGQPGPDDLVVRDRLGGHRGRHLPASGGRPEGGGEQKGRDDRTMELLSWRQATFHPKLGPTPCETAVSGR